MRRLVLLFVIAALIRGVVCFLALSSYESDPDAYRAIAETLAETGVFGLIAPSGETVPSAFRPPLYPLVLSWLVIDGKLSAVAIALFHSLLGATTVMLTFLAARRLLGGAYRQPVGYVAAALVLVDPILIRQSTEVMTETLATFLAVAVIWWWAEAIRSQSIGRSFVLGALIVLAYFCRPTFLVWGLLLAIGMLAVRSSRENGRRWVHAAIVAAVLATSVVGWTIRNSRSIGHPVWATTHGGYTLLLANNPSFYEYLRTGSWGEVWDSASFLHAYQYRFDGAPSTEAFWQKEWSGPSAMERGAVIGVSEYDDDRLAYEAAKATIRREPGMFVWSCVIRVARLWSPIPHATTQRSWAVTTAVGIWYVAVYIAVLLGTWKLWNRRESIPCSAWWPVAALLLTLTAVHAVYWSNMRMRAPAIPALAILAAASVVRKPSEAADVADR